MLTLIFVVIPLLALVGIVAYYYYKAKRTLKGFSLEACGIPPLNELFNMAKQDYIQTPKPIAGMTRMYLPLIQKEFPDFSYEEMKRKSDNVITSYLLAVNGDDIKLLQEGNSELRNKLVNQLSLLNDKSYREHFEEIKLHRTELYNYTKRDGRCIITFETSLEYIHYVTDATGKIVDGRRNMKEQARYEADLIYIQDRSVVENDLDGAIGLNCPNCGAPITSLGAKVCPYCLTPIVELNIHAWSFSDVRER